MRWRPNFRRGWRFYLAAWLLPLLAVIVGAAIYYLLFPQSFDPNLSAARNDAIPFSVAGIANPWMVMLSYTLQYMIIDGLLLSVLAMGEEFGWRGYLLPMGVAILSLIMANMLMIAGWAEYFPWAIPMLYAQGEISLTPVTCAIVLLTALVGMLGTYLWWKAADQNR